MSPPNRIVGGCDPELSSAKEVVSVTEKPGTYAVLTGDIVKSRKLSPEQLQTVRDVIQEAVRIVDGWKPGLIVGRGRVLPRGCVAVAAERPELGPPDGRFYPREPALSEKTG